jgi:hypothetical protein
MRESEGRKFTLTTGHLIAFLGYPETESDIHIRIAGHKTRMTDKGILFLIRMLTTRYRLPHGKLPFWNLVVSLQGMETEYKLSVFQVAAGHFALVVVARVSPLY